MVKNTYLGRSTPAAVKFNASLSNADGRLMRERIEVLGLRGPSEFIQRLLHQAIGARLAVVYDAPSPVAAPSPPLRASA